MVVELDALVELFAVDGVPSEFAGDLVGHALDTNIAAGLHSHRPHLIDRSRKRQTEQLRRGRNPLPSFGALTRGRYFRAGLDSAKGSYRSPRSSEARVL